MWRLFKQRELHNMKTIQSQLKAPKGQFNSFGKYRYRSCEDIVEAVKPLLAEAGYHLILSDDIIAVGDRVYVKATATVFNGTEILGTATAFAREPLDKKGMDASQITGTASSYARKYALNGLLAIDDTKDADTMAPVVDEPITPAQYLIIGKLLLDTDSSLVNFCKHFKISEVVELKQSDFERAKTALEAKLELLK
jgi:hypothetical protein